MIDIVAIRRQILYEEFYNQIWRAIALVDQINAYHAELSNLDVMITSIVATLSKPLEPTRAQIYRDAYAQSCLDQFEMELKENYR